MNPHNPEESGSVMPCGKTLPLARKWQEDQPRVAWTIAGFDPSNGAGITADLATFAAHGLFGCAAITALTVQNTVAVYGWSAVEPGALRATLERLSEDMPAAGVKVGMLGTPALAAVIARQIATMRSCTPTLQVVLDPVLRSSSGRALFPAEALEQLHAELLPVVDWITPNWTELAALTQEPVENAEQCETAARLLAARHPGLHVVATGGDQEQPEDLLLMPGGKLFRIVGKHIQTTSTHGTGCAFSSALLAALVAGAEPLQAVQRAKSFVEGALLSAPGLGQGRGPMNLLWPLRRRKEDLAAELLP